MDSSQNNGRSFSIIVDRPLFCIVSLIVISSTITRCVSEIMEPINRLAIAAAKRKEKK